MKCRLSHGVLLPVGYSSRITNAVAKGDTTAPGNNIQGPGQLQLCQGGEPADERVGHQSHDKSSTEQSCTCPSMMRRPRSQQPAMAPSSVEYVIGALKAP